MTVLFAWILQASAAGAVLAAALLLVKHLFKDKLDARWHYYIWLLLLARLLLPFAPESGISAFNAVPVREILDPVSLTHALPPDRPPQPVAPGGLTGAGPGPVPGTPGADTPLPGGAPSANPGEAPANNPSDGESLSPASGIGGAVFYITWIWLAGAAVLGLYMLFINARLWLKYRRSAPSGDSYLATLVAECKQELGVRARLPLVTCPELKTPALFGFFRPRLLLPEGLSGWLARGELRGVIMHELAHLKRADIPVYWLTGLLQVLHWFNPLIWYSFYRMRQDAEVACDAFVLSRCRPDERRGYGETMLKLAQAGAAARPALLPGPAGIVEAESQLKRRITAIARFRKSSLALTAAGLALGLLLGALFLTTARSRDTAGHISIGRPDIIFIFMPGGMSLSVTGEWVIYDRLIDCAEETLRKNAQFKNTTLLNLPGGDISAYRDKGGLEFIYNDPQAFDFLGEEAVSRLFFDLLGPALFIAAMDGEGPGDDGILYCDRAYHLAGGEPLSGFLDALLNRPGITGYVIDAAEEEILVVAGELTELYRRSFDAWWVIIPEGMATRPAPGQKVAVRFAGPALQPYGLRAAAEITILEPPVYPGARLAEDEAIRAALQALPVMTGGIAIRAVKEVSFDRAQRRWSVVFGDGGEPEPEVEIFVSVDDRTAAAVRYGSTLERRRVRTGSRYVLYPGPSPETVRAIPGNEILGGVIVEVVHRDGEWVRVRSDAYDGWIPRWYLSDDATQPVLDLDETFSVLNQDTAGYLYPDGPPVVELTAGRLLKPLQEWNGWYAVGWLPMTSPGIYTAWVPQGLLSAVGAAEAREGIVRPGTVAHRHPFETGVQPSTFEIEHTIPVLVRERRDGYLWVEAAGGWNAWILAEDLIIDLDYFESIWYIPKPGH